MKIIHETVHYHVKIPTCRPALESFPARDRAPPRFSRMLLQEEIDLLSSRFPGPFLPPSSSNTFKYNRIPPTTLYHRQIDTLCRSSSRISPPTSLEGPFNNFHRKTEAKTEPSTSNTLPRLPTPPADVSWNHSQLFTLSPRPYLRP